VSTRDTAHAQELAISCQLIQETLNYDDFSGETHLLYIFLRVVVVLFREALHTKVLWNMQDPERGITKFKPVATKDETSRVETRAASALATDKAGPERRNQFCQKT
jgi:hypothetical protein